MAANDTNRTVDVLNRLNEAGRYRELLDVVAGESLRKPDGLAEFAGREEAKR